MRGDRYGFFKDRDYDPLYDELAEEVPPGSGNYVVSRFTDCFGREMEAHRCEYCGKLSPVRNDPFGFHPENVFMRQIELNNGKKVWRCNTCAVDIINKS